MTWKETGDSRGAHKTIECGRESLTDFRVVHEIKRGLFPPRSYYVRILIVRRARLRNTFVRQLDEIQTFDDGGSTHAGPVRALNAF